MKLKMKRPKSILANRRGLVEHDILSVGELKGRRYVTCRVYDIDTTYTIEAPPTNEVRFYGFTGLNGTRKLPKDMKVLKKSVAVKKLFETVFKNVV